MMFSSALDTCCMSLDKAGKVCFSRNMASISRVLTAAARADSRARSSKGSCLSIDVLSCSERPQKCLLFQPPHAWVTWGCQLGYHALSDLLL